MQSFKIILAIGREKVPKKFAVCAIDCSYCKGAIGL